MAFPNEVRTISAPSSWAVRATAYAMLCGVRTPVMSRRFFDRSIGGMLLAARPEAFPVRQDLPGRVGARASGDASAWVRSGPTQVQPVGDKAVPPRAQHGPPSEELVQARFPVEGVALRQAVVPLEVERREDAPAHDQVAEPRRVLPQRLDHQVAQR